MNDPEVVNVSIDREKHTVLVVDDNPATRYSTGRVLRAAGFKTVEAASGQEAIDAAAANDISAVVLDVHLPDFDGFEVCRRLRAHPRTAVVPVIHLSATYVEDKHKVAGLNSGADAYITHPAEPPILVATVQALVRARLAEEQVRRSEAKFRAIYTEAQSGIALIDAGGRFLEVNPAMLTILGRGEPDVLGKHVSEFAAPEWRDAVHRRFERGGSGDKVLRETFVLRQPNGDEIHLEWSVSPHVEPGVRIGVATNISDRMRLEQQRQQLLEREQAARIVAERHSQTKDDFIAVLSHELRNPLNAMLMGVHMLQMRSVTPEVARGLGMIEKNAKSQARIISDILDVSRLNSGKLTLDRSFVDAAALVNTTLEGMQAAVQEKQISLKVDVEAAGGPVWIDPTRFEQVLWNIVSNAIKFSETGGSVIVLLARRKTSLQLIVRDYGKGIDQKFLAQMFDKFSQGVSPENRAHGGLGLGMSIVKHLAELHSGMVKAESDGPGLGTTITVELPLLEPASDHMPSEYHDSGADIEVDIRGIAVLVVEDDAQALEMLSMILRDRGAHVTIAADYPSALHAFSQSTPDLVVSDVGLPGKDGYALVRELRVREEASNADHRFGAIALTAFGRPEDRAMALEAGFDEHIAKPVKPYKLIATIGRMRGR